MVHGLHHPCGDTNGLIFGVIITLICGHKLDIETLKNNT